MNRSNFCGGDFNGSVNVQGDFTVIITDKKVEQVIDDPEQLKAIKKTHGSSFNYRTVSWKEFVVKYVENCDEGINAVAKATGMGPAACWGRHRAMVLWGWDIPEINDTPPPPPMTKTEANALIRATKREKLRKAR